MHPRSPRAKEENLCILSHIRAKEWDNMKKLQDTDARILSAIELRAREPLAKIARCCGLRESTVRTSLQRLIDERLIVTRRIYLNPYLLGWTNFAVYLVLAADGAASDSPLRLFLAKQKRISWIAEFGGEYHLAFSIAARHISEVSRFLERIAEQFPDSVSRKEISVRTEIRTFPRKFLNAEAASGVELLQGGIENTQLDEIDARVLRAAGSPGFESFRRLAERAGISSSTFDRRLKALEAKKVIEGFYYILDPGLFQMQEYRLLLSVPSAKPKLNERLLAEARRHPNIRKWIRCVGSWDYELEINVRSSRDASALVSELRKKFAREIGVVNSLPLFGETSVPAYQAILE